jgi:hypothetical protein
VNNCGKLITPAGSESYTKTEDHPILHMGQQPSKQKRFIKIRSTDPPTQHKAHNKRKHPTPLMKYKNCRTTETTPAANNPRPDLRHIFKKAGRRLTVTGTHGKQHDNQQQQEYRVIRN